MNYDYLLKILFIRYESIITRNISPSEDLCSSEELKKQKSEKRWQYYML